jgi:serine/threonine protein kinase
MKPENVLINLRGDVKVGDFGIARSAKSVMAAGVGTAAYAAPERLNGGAGGPEADVWALGIMAYEALTGDAPHRCETLTEVWEFATRGALPRLPAGEPAQLATFVELSVLRDPAARASVATLAALPFSPRATSSEFESFLRTVRIGEPGE